MYIARRMARMFAVLLAAAALAPAPATAGRVFLTGHDPDFHTQAGAGTNLFATGLNYVTAGTYNDHNAATKFLWIESAISPPSGHLRGADSLPMVGAQAGTDYDVVDATGLATVNFGNYIALALASTFGGTLSAAEIGVLVTRSADVAAFINGGGGLFASAECYPCGADLAGSATNLFAFLPVTVTSIGTNAPFTVTPFGATLGLADGDLNDPTHNSFGLVGGLSIVDTDASGNATTLAGNVTLSETGFTDIPEPASMALLAGGLATLAARRRNRA